MRERIFLAVSPPMLLLTPLFATINKLSINPLSGGAIALLLAIGLLGLALGLLAAVSSGRGRLGEIVAAAALGGVAALFADTVFSGQTALAGYGALGVWGIGAAFLVVAGLLFWLTRRYIGTVLFAASAAMLAFTWLPAAQAQTPEPPLVYIVLDEMIGLDGIDRELPGGLEAYDAIRDVLTRHGFRIYPRAYSRNYYSSRSIPAALNFDWEDDGAGNVSPYSKDDGLQLALFDQMTHRGYSISVWQTAHMDFCSGRAVECAEYPSFDPESAYYQLPGGTFVATIQILHSAYEGTFLISYISKRFVDIASGGQFVWVPKSFDAHGFPAWFDTFKNALSSAETLQGRVLFAHFLMPHSPHILSPSCEVIRLVQNPYELRQRAGLEGEAFERTRAAFYAEYFEQIRCLSIKLDALFAELGSRPDFENATVVLHGDHGSRISAGIHQEYLDSRDIIDNYSALFAIRAPGISGEVDLRQTSVQRLVAEYLGPVPPDLLGQDNGTVVIDTLTPGRSILREVPAIGLVE